MPTLDVTVGGITANSYETHAEANTYFDGRLPIKPLWVTSGQEAALIMATRVLDAMAQPYRTYVPNSQGGYYRVRRQWTGLPASSTQRLAWPRVGMFDSNGNAIPSNTIPQALKDAESELAGQLLKADRTLDNAAIVGGIASVSAGSVSVSFREGIIAQVLPDYVLNLMPVSWFTEELIEYSQQAEFDVI